MSKSNSTFRRWLRKLGLASDPASEEQIPTAELPNHGSSPETEAEALTEGEPAPELLTEQDLEITTADTKPLPAEVPEEPASIESKTDDEEMESKITQAGNGLSGNNDRGSGPLLDLGEFAPARAAAEEDFVLDLDFDDEADVPAAGRIESHDAVTEQLSKPTYFESDSTRGEQPAAAAYEPVSESVRREPQPLELTSDPMADTQELRRSFESGPSVGERAFAEPEILEGEAVRMVSTPTAVGQITLDQLSPEAIDAIARRAVEMLSEKVVQEIAWEVVPQLAELMIKRQLEEKSS